MRLHGVAVRRSMALPLLVCVALVLVPTGVSARFAAPAETTDTAAIVERGSGVALGDGAYEMTGTVFGTDQDDLIGKDTASGFTLKGDDELVALPACTESSCPWLALDRVTERWGKQTACAEADGNCWVEIVSPETNQCTVAPVLDVGPLFTNDNWWADTDDRTYDLERGRTAADVVLDGGDLGFGVGDSNIGFDVQNDAGHSSGIDLAEGTWRALGFSRDIGIRPLTVRLLWQAGITHDEACQSNAASAASASTGGNATAIDELNLRAAPSLTAEILDVMPKGTSVTVSGAGRNGFYPVVFDDAEGWASAEWLQAAGVTGTASEAVLAITTDELNLRAGPSTADEIRAVIPPGGLVTLNGGGSNGFLAVTFDGVEGFAYAAFLRGGSPPSIDGAKVRTTDELNLRAGPTTDDPILATIPNDTTVTLTGEGKNGFLAVRADDEDGWVAATYLTGFPTATNRSTLNLRQAAGLDSEVVTTIPAGTKVQVLGPDENGFVQVSVDGRTGYVFAAYLT